ARCVSACARWEARSRRQRRREPDRFARPRAHRRGDRVHLLRCVRGRRRTDESVGKRGGGAYRDGGPPGRERCGLPRRSLQDRGARADLSKSGELARSGSHVVFTETERDTVAASIDGSIQLAKAGKIEAAIDNLAGVLKECKEGPNCDSARELDSTLRDALKD